MPSFKIQCLEIYVHYNKKINQRYSKVNTMNSLNHRHTFYYLPKPLKMCNLSSSFKTHLQIINKK